jgi:hypothetical protein
MTKARRPMNSTILRTTKSQIASEVIQFGTEFPSSLRRALQFKCCPSVRGCARVCGGVQCWRARRGWILPTHNPCLSVSVLRAIPRAHRQHRADPNSFSAREHRTCALGFKRGHYPRSCFSATLQLGKVASSIPDYVIDLNSSSLGVGSASNSFLW